MVRITKKSNESGECEDAGNIDEPIPSTSETSNEQISSTTTENKKSIGQQRRRFLSSWTDKFPWLNYNAERDIVLCNVCKAVRKRNLLMCSKKDAAFLDKGFSNWKKAIEKFESHESSDCHKEAVLKFANYKSEINVSAILSTEKARQMKESSSCLMKIITSLRYLAMQGIPIRGHTDETSNLMNLLHLRSEDSNELKRWLNQGSYKWISHDIQNEIVNLMAHAVLRKVLDDVKKAVYFSIIADETTDINTKEQFSFCVR